MIDRRLLTHFDVGTFFIVLGLLVVGFSTLLSATFSKWPHFYQKEFLWLMIGFAFMAASIIVNYTFLEKHGYAIYGSVILLLISVFFIGKTTGGAKRWIPLGFFTLQPSELAKLSLIITLAKYFSTRKIPPRGMGFKDLAPPFFILFLPFLLIAKQPDLGTAIILWMIFWSMAAAVKIRPRVFAALFLALGAAFPFGWRALKDYQKARLTSFLDPSSDPLGTGYHIMQSKIAIGSGGFFGKGFMKGTQGKLMFLPEHHTDFIFSVFAEEWGLIGSLVVLGLFFFLVARGLGAASSSKDRFGFLLAFGISSMFFWHIVINIGMVSGLLPVVGVPLPFMSYGGSFLVTSMIAVGILINIRMRRFMF